MANTIIDDRFSPARETKRKKKRTTRFYGVKFIEARLSNNEPYFTTTPYSGQQNMLNSREYFREVYGPFLCSLLLTSALTVILGAALALSGYYVPGLTVRKLVEDKFTEAEAVRRAAEYNQTLHGLRIAGIILLGFGGVGILVLLLIPFICLRSSEYHPIPTDEPGSPTHISPPSLSSKSRSPEPDVNYSVVKQHVQPRNHSTKRMHHHRPSYEKGFLSPELNRGPIFVSDDTCKITDQKIRSSSFDRKSSPDHTRTHRASSFNTSECLNLDVTRTPVKVGSFHSLR